MNLLFNTQLVYLNNYFIQTYKWKAKHHPCRKSQRTSPLLKTLQPSKLPLKRTPLLPQTERKEKGRRTRKRAQKQRLKPPPPRSLKSPRPTKRKTSPRLPPRTRGSCG
jgi:hypothetical protein